MKLKLELQTPGARLRAIRAYCSPSRNDFCTKTRLSESTLKAWENDVARLTRKGANALVGMFADFGVFCTATWLLDGEPPSPLRALGLNNPALMPENIFVEKEFENLKSYYKEDFCFHKVMDQNMSPFFKAGDYVVGLAIPVTEIPYFWEEVALVETTEGATLLRKITKGGQPGFVTLEALNLPDHHPQAKLVDTEVKKAYRVVWHRTPIHTEKVKKGTRIFA